MNDNPYQMRSLTVVEQQRHKTRTTAMFLLVAWVAFVPLMLLAQLLMLYWGGEADPFFREVGQQSASFALGIYAAIFLFWMLWSAVLIFAITKRWLPWWSIGSLVVVTPGVSLVYLVVTSHFNR